MGGPANAETGGGGGSVAKRPKKSEVGKKTEKTAEVGYPRGKYKRGTNQRQRAKVKGSYSQG